MVRRAPVIPLELWSHIFSFLSTIDEVANSSREAWADVVTNNPRHTYLPTPAVVECNKTKRAIGLVSKDFYELSRHVALESVTLRTVASLRHFALQIEEEPGFAGIVGRCTKRVDLRSILEDLGRYGDARNVGRDIQLVLRSGRNLACLMLPEYHQRGTAPPFSNVVPNSCTFLEVLCYSFPGNPATCFPSIARFTRLRVLYISTMSETSVPRSCEFPLVHTLIGPGDGIRTFAETQLPSLCTLVLKSHARVGVGLSQFLFNHGKIVESLDIVGDINGLHSWSSNSLANVKRLVISDYEEIAIGMIWPNLQELGIFGRNVSTSLSLILYNLDMIENQREKGNYCNLESIRILCDDSAKILRARVAGALKLRERRLRGWSIRLEDGHGNLLLSPPLPSPGPPS